MPLSGFQLSNFLSHSLQTLYGLFQALGFIIVFLGHCTFLLFADLSDLTSSDRVHVHIKGQICHSPCCCTDVPGLVMVADVAWCSPYVLCLKDLPNQIQRYDANLRSSRGVYVASAGYPLCSNLLCVPIARVTQSWLLKAVRKACLQNQSSIRPCTLSWHQQR